MTAAKPLRVFLSYGHDANEELVLRIHADLENRGHDVWIDKKEIRPGDDWRREITERILKSHQVLSFLSKHSTRDPGVCRDEVAIAVGVKGGCIKTILVESEVEVQPPVNISHVQWLDMHDWKDGHGVVHIVKDEPANGDATWEQWYQTRFAEIVRVVESDESLRFAGEIETLNGYLKPIQSEARIFELLRKGYVGREWLFEAVEQWRQDKAGKSRVFWIMGEPGVGKSAFAAQLTHTRGDTVIAAQFVEWDKPDHRSPERVIRSLAFQLATRLPDYRKLLLTLSEIAKLDGKNAAELFDYLLANRLKSVIGGGRERYLVVIDALDEAGDHGRNPLVEMLARHAGRLPDWLGIVVTSRSEFDVTTPFQALNPIPFDTQSESNRTDLCYYLQQRLAPQLDNRSDADHLLDQIIDKSEGVFLYIERFCDDVQQDHLSLDRPDQFPQGLGGIYYQWFQRQFPDLEQFEQTIEPMLGAVLAAREPLPIEILQGIFGWREPELRKWLRILGSLFPVTEGKHGEVIKPYHKSPADWLAEERRSGPYHVSLVEGHRLLGEAGWRQYLQGAYCMSSYHLLHLPTHLSYCGESARSRTIRQDETYVSALQNNGDLARALTIYSEYEQRFRNSGDVEGLQITLGVLALILRAQKDLTRSIALLKEQERLCRRMGDKDALQRTLGNRALVLQDRGDLDGAMALYAERERICRESANLDGLQRTLGQQAVILQERGESERAMVLHEEEEKICRQLGNLDGLQLCLGNQANVLSARGNVDGAMALLKEAEQICRHLGKWDGLQRILANQASILLKSGDSDSALMLYEEHERICRQFGNLESLQPGLESRASALRSRGDFADARSLQNEEQRLCRQLGNIEGIVSSLANQALVLKAMGRAQEGVSLAEEAYVLAVGRGNTALANQIQDLLNNLRRAATEE